MLRIGISFVATVAVLVNICLAGEPEINELIATSKQKSPEPGEWIFLTGPGRLAILIVSPGGSPAYTAWGRRGEEEYRWPEVRMVWSSVRSLEEARRDIPEEWEIRSPNGELTVTIANAGMDVRAAAGEGPILPVEGLFQVTGSVVLAGDSIEVWGLVRHVQG